MRTVAEIVDSAHRPLLYIVPFCGLYLEPNKVIPKRNYFGAYEFSLNRETQGADSESISACGPHSRSALADFACGQSSGLGFMA